MKSRIFNIILITFLSALILISAGTANKSAPALVYVYSESMEPVIMVDDGFLIIPSKNYKPGDIVVFRPLVLETGHITHRIYSVTENGFITKGDNSPYTDQEAGEPEVPADRIIGKALIIRGKPLIIKGLGRVMSLFETFDLRIVSFVLVMLGVFFSIFKEHIGKKKKKSRIRLRVKHLYKAVILICVVLALVSGILGEKTEEIRYLVSSSPGDRDDHVALNEKGSMQLKVKNRGPVPVWIIAKPLSPITTIESDRFIKPFSISIITVELPERNTIGWYQGYIKVYFYPVILPYKVEVFFHDISFYMVVFMNSFAFFILLYVIVRGINYFNRNEEFLPVKIFRSKKLKRRFKNVLGKYGVRRRT